MSVLLSIKPKYIEKIKKGVKLYEFRRVIFKQDISEIYVYATAPIKKIVGKFTIDEIIQGVPQQLWKLYYKEAGISKKDFFSYYKGAHKGYAIKIKRFEMYNEPIDPYKLNSKFIPPQSYAYTNNVLPNLFETNT